jgi:hypothetical protein
MGGPNSMSVALPVFELCQYVSASTLWLREPERDFSTAAFAIYTARLLTYRS